MAVTLTIAGASKTFKARTLRISQTANGRTSAAFTVESTDGTYRPALDAEVIITEGATRIFGGLIDRPREEGLIEGANAAISTAISAVDFNAYTERRFVKEVVAAGTTLASFLGTLVTNYLATYGVTLDGGQVTGPALPALEYDYRSLTEVLNELASITAKDGDPYVWNIDNFKVLSMYQPSSAAAPFDIDGTTLPIPEVEGDIEIEPTRRGYANKIIVKSPDQTFANYSESIAGDDVTYTWVLAYEIASHRGFVIVTPGGFYEPLGEGHPTGPTWTIDADNRTLTRLTGPLPSGYTATITYDGILKIEITASDSGEIGSVGIWERVVTVEKIPNDTTGQAIADAELAKSILPEKSIKYRTRQTGIEPGQTQTINVPRRNINVSAIITEVEIRDDGRRLVRDVTAVSGSKTNLDRGWRDTYKLWAGDKTGSSKAGGGTTIGPGLQGGGGWPGLPDKSVQFNDGGTAFGGDASFIFEKTEHSVVCGDLSDIATEDCESCQVFGYDNHIDPGSTTPTPFTLIDEGRFSGTFNDPFGWAYAEVSGAGTYDTPWTLEDAAGNLNGAQWIASGCIVVGTSPSFIQGKGEQNLTSSGTQTLTFDSNVTAGNVIVVGVTNHSIGDGRDSITTTCITDSQGNTYTRRTAYPHTLRTNLVSGIFTAVAGSTGACTVTLTSYDPSSGNGPSAMGIAEVSVGSPTFVASSDNGSSATPNGGIMVASSGGVILSWVTEFSGKYHNPGDTTDTNVLTGSATFGTQVTITATRAVAFGLDDDPHTHATPGKAIVYGDFEVTGDTTLAGTSITGQYGSTTYNAGNSGAALTIDWDNGNTQLITLTAACTLTLSNPIDGGRYLLFFKQGGAGSFTVTWPSSVKWSAGTAPTLSTAVGKVDLVTLVWVAALGASGNYLAAANTDYTPA